LDIDPKVLLHINGYDVKRRNSLNPDVLVPTQTFIKFFSTNKVSFKQPKKKKGCSNRYYKVRRGDSISKVARKFKIKIDTFNKMNPSIAHLRPGFLVKVCP
jgi:LysM repeat protein